MPIFRPSPTGPEQEGERPPTASHHHLCALSIARPLSRVTASQLRLLRAGAPFRGPLYHNSKEAETPSINSSSSTLELAMARPTLRRLRLGLGRCEKRAPRSTATGMPTTGCPAPSRCSARCTRMWVTSTCITRCARGRVATSDRTTATWAARPSIASHTRTPVSVAHSSWGCPALAAAYRHVPRTNPREMESVNDLSSRFLKYFIISQRGVHHASSFLSCVHTSQDEFDPYPDATGSAGCACCTPRLWQPRRHENETYSLTSTTVVSSHTCL